MTTTEPGTTELPRSSIFGKTDDEIEHFIEGFEGKVEVLKDVITLDMPEVAHKGYIGGEFVAAVKPTVKYFGGKCLGGTAGITFSNDRLVSPDMSVWSKDRPYSRYGQDHLWQIAPAPNLVLECEWAEELDRPNKALDKIAHYYFDDTCTGTVDVFGTPTTVQEAWVYVLHQNTAHQGAQFHKVVVEQIEEIDLRAPWKHIPILRDVLLILFQVTSGIVHSQVMEMWRASALCGWWGFLWILAANYVRFLCFVLVDTIPASPTPPPENDHTPYLMIAYRNRPDHFVYYHFTPHKMFVPPWESSLRWIRPIKTDTLCG